MPGHPPVTNAYSFFTFPLTAPLNNARTRARPISTRARIPISKKNLLIRGMRGVGGCPAKLPGTSGGSTCRNRRLRDGQPVQIGAADLAPLGLGVAAVRTSAAQAYQPRHIVGVPLAVRLY